MTFTYSRTVREYYDPIRDEVYRDEYDFKYTPEHDELLDAVADIWVSKNYKGEELTQREYQLAMKVAKDIIQDQDTLDCLADEYEDELKEYFEDIALESERWD